MITSSLHHASPLAFIVALCAFAAGPSLGRTPSKTDVTPSFTNEPFVHPKAVEDLRGLISDSRDQVVALDILGTHKSNRYCCEPYKVSTNAQSGAKSIGYESAPGETHHLFSYVFLGQCDCGVMVLYTFEAGEGSGSDHRLLFLRMAEDRGLALEDGSKTIMFGPPRMLLMKMGELSLGDRWKGQLKVQGNQVLVGKDHGWFSKERDDGDLAVRSNDWETVWTFDLSRRQPAWTPAMVAPDAGNRHK